MAAATSKGSASGATMARAAWYLERNHGDVRSTADEVASAEPACPINHAAPEPTHELMASSAAVAPVPKSALPIESTPWQIGEVTAEPTQVEAAPTRAISGARCRRGRRSSR